MENVMAVAKKTVIKNTALVKVLDTSLTNLEAANANGAKALAAATKKSKQSSAEGKRLSKKRVALIKRNKTAAAKAKKEPVAANKKALNEVVKELAAVRKEAAKNKILLEQTPQASSVFFKYFSISQNDFSLSNSPD